MARRKIERQAAETGRGIDMKTGKEVQPAPLPKICERIRFFRKHQHLEQKALAMKLGIHPNTVSSWEAGRSRPDVSMIPQICDTLGITFQQLYGLPAPAGSLTEREQKLLDGYRELEGGGRYVVDTLMDSLLTVQRGREQEEKAKRKIYELPLADSSLAAGIGDASGYEGQTTPFYVYDVPWIERADCVFRVNGDSMEPAYHDGDYVLVERIPEGQELREGETGAFAVDNELYIKEYESDGLHSLNPAYPVMKFEEGSRVYLIGRVLSRIVTEDLPGAEEIRMYEALKG